MRVAVDTNGLYTTQAGVARYIRGLLRGLRRLEAADLDISELAWEVENFGYRQPRRWLRTFYRELVWGSVIAPRELLRRGVDLLHTTGTFFVSPPPAIRNVVTLHDVAVLRHPERFRNWHRRAELGRLRRLSRVQRVVCVSQFSADEAIQLLGLSPRRVEVVYNGCDFHETEVVPKEEAPADPVPVEFLLFVGSLEPGKNLSLLRKAYELGSSQGKQLPPLVIVGARWTGVGHEGIPGKNWHYLGRQPDSALVYLYRRAIALVFPSKYEGFGLPILEAMALGCPVICSKLASLPEVGGEAVLYADQEPALYLEAMRRLWESDALRQDLINKGRERAKLFSWGRCASETCRIYREVFAE